MMLTALDQVKLYLQVGKNSFSFLLGPLQLTGGGYYVDVQITNASDAIILASQSSKWFYVSGVALSHEADHGVFEPQRKWVAQRQPVAPPIVVAAQPLPIA